MLKPKTTANRTHENTQGGLSWITNTVNYAAISLVAFTLQSCVSTTKNQDGNEYDPQSYPSESSPQNDIRVVELKEQHARESAVRGVQNSIEEHEQNVLKQSKGVFLKCKGDEKSEAYVQEMLEDLKCEGGIDSSTEIGKNAQITCKLNEDRKRTSRINASIEFCKSKAQDFINKSLLKSSTSNENQGVLRAFLNWLQK